MYGKNTAQGTVQTAVLLWKTEQLLAHRATDINLLPTTASPVRDNTGPDTNGGLDLKVFDKINNITKE